MDDLTIGHGSVLTECAPLISPGLKTHAKFIPSFNNPGLDHAFMQVREFHEVFDQPLPDEPTMQPLERAMRRADWVRSECDELDAARTTTDQADAYIDIIYFALGGIVELGIMPQALLDIVHGANMNKRHMIEGKLTVVKNDIGKVVKPEGWQAPEPQLAAEVHLQSKRRPLFVRSV